jgi:hypothetical protein
MKNWQLVPQVFSGGLRSHPKILETFVSKPREYKNKLQ